MSFRTEILSFPFLSVVDCFVWPIPYDSFFMRDRCKQVGLPLRRMSLLRCLSSNEHKSIVSLFSSNRTFFIGHNPFCTIQKQSKQTKAAYEQMLSRRSSIQLGENPNSVGDDFEDTRGDNSEFVLIPFH